jgi:four helix bundle protein
MTNNKLLNWLKRNIEIQIKSDVFAIRIVKLFQYSTKEKKDYAPVKRMLLSFTSIFANIEKAVGSRVTKL